MTMFSSQQQEQELITNVKSAKNLSSSDCWGPEYHINDQKLELKNSPSPVSYFEKICNVVAMYINGIHSAASCLLTEGFSTNSVLRLSMNLDCIYQCSVLKAKMQVTNMNLPKEKVLRCGNDNQSNNGTGIYAWDCFHFSLQHSMSAPQDQQYNTSTCCSV